MDWKDAFDNFGIKEVKATDKVKKAYVVNSDQRKAIEAAGISPARTRPGTAFDITVLFDGSKQTIDCSYYYSRRSTKADRTPEARMGHGFISSWLQVGDLVVIGNIGSQLFAAKLHDAPKSSDETTNRLISRLNEKNTFDRAAKAVGKPQKKIVARDDFVRNPYVVAAAIMRSKGECEMPGCTCTLFHRDDGTPYLEVHHIVPLAEGGDDTLINAAALCPYCHRKLHHGVNRSSDRIVLHTHITSLSKT